MKAKHRYELRPQPHHLTEHGLQVFADQLYVLEQRRQGIIQEMQALISQATEPDIGDSLRLLQQIEIEITRINDIINYSVVLQPQSNDSVMLGSKVQLQCGDEEHTFTVVDSVECNPEQGYISDKSPLGQALIGKQSDELFSVIQPRNSKVYKILQIS